ncbi:hypothetical protein [Alkalicoccobacillus porphyridii]|nr:hypothetical protein [Alkalicoccobacillus porphyridii]
MVEGQTITSLTLHMIITQATMIKTREYDIVLLEQEKGVLTWFI